jgi:hypothetical protein
MRFQMKGVFVRGRRERVEVLSKVKEDTRAGIIFYREIRDVTLDPSMIHDVRRSSRICLH